MQFYIRFPKTNCIGLGKQIPFIRIRENKSANTHEYISSVINSYSANLNLYMQSLNVVCTVIAYKHNRILSQENFFAEK